MSIFGSDFEAYLRTPEKRGLPDSALTQYMGDVWAPSSAGVPVSSSTAYGLSTWWGAVSLISWSVARPRMRPFTLAPNDIRRYEDGHPVSKLLNVQPNPNMTALVFRRVVTAHVLVYGNGYAEIEWDNAGRAKALWPLMPTEVEPVIRGGEITYLVRGVDTGLRSEDVLHIQGLGFDGLRGYSVLSMARQSLALGLAAQQFGATFFGNGAFPALLASTEQKLEQPQRDRIRESWNALHQGPDRAHRLAVLEGGLKVEKLTIPPDDAQFLETRQFQREDICAYFNLNPAMLGYNAGNAPGGNYEAQKISFVSDTIAPWWRAWEQEIERKLIGPGLRQVEHEAEELLQYLSMNETRLKNKADAASTLVRAGFDPEDVTDVCGLPPMRFEKPEPPPAPAPPPADPTPEPAEPDPAVTEAQRALLVHAIGLLVRIEAGEARRAAEKGRLKAWATDFYPRHQVRLVQSLEPVVRAIRPRGDWRGAAEAVAVEMVARSMADLVAGADAVELVASRWELERPSEVAGRVMEGR
jgi:HK97 family phage portal protein